MICKPEFKCPKCGSLHVQGTFEYACGSIVGLSSPIREQSDDCRIRELEAENKQLKEELAKSKITY